MKSISANNVCHWIESFSSVIEWMNRKILFFYYILFPSSLFSIQIITKFLFPYYIIFIPFKFVHYIRDVLSRQLILKITIHVSNTCRISYIYINAY